MEPAESRSRLLLVDDHALFREGLAGLFAYQDDFVVIGEAEDGASALAQVAQLGPDMVLMDIDLPGVDGIAVTRQLKIEFPDLIVVMLTVHDATAKLMDAIKAGAQGYIVKSVRSVDLLEQLRGLPPREPGCGVALSGECVQRRWAAECSDAVRRQTYARRGCTFAERPHRSAGSMDVRQRPRRWAAEWVSELHGTMGRAQRT